MFTAQRYHDISCGHRVFGHESKCAHLHGHNYRIHFFCTARDLYHPIAGTTLPQLDEVGRVIDFSEIKSKLCMWVEVNWDHKFLVWEKDPIANKLLEADREGVVLTAFNPTAENMAEYLVKVVGPKKLATNIALFKCIVEETRKCSATFELLFGSSR